MSYSLIMTLRDLGVEDSISEHINLIRENGFVWGGWWAKPDEELPIEGIKLISDEIANNQFVTLFFFNKDRCELHKAIVEDIKYHHSGEKIISPDVEHTPKYYSDSSLMLWFRIKQITAWTDNEILHNYSYVDNTILNVSKNSDGNNICVLDFNKKTYLKLRYFL